MITSLEKEVSKVVELNPKEYYVFTSKPLSSKKIDEIYALFKGYMPDKNYIFDQGKLNELLSDERYSEVLRKHFKLWLVSSNVLSLALDHHIYIDSDFLLDEIEEESKFFVVTTAFQEALNILQENNILVLEGDPGVGKTFISKMLLLDYVEKGYKVRYVSDNSISDLKHHYPLTVT